MSNFIPFLVTAAERGINAADKADHRHIDTNFSYFSGATQDGDFLMAIYCLAQNIVWGDTKRNKAYAAGLTELSQNFPGLTTHALTTALETSFAGRDEYRTAQEISKLVKGDAPVAKAVLTP